MDGLTISTSESLLETGRTSSQLKEARLKSEVAGPEGTGKSFADTLEEAVGEVNELQKNADTLMQQLATGENKNIPEVLVAAEKADVALKLMVQVRNKIIDAYHEVMKMQV
jgi:flagellar hook-basal body complex protein FliE